jgi:hypothetical protein
MPKIPTFTATGRPTAEVGAVKSNIQIPLTQTIGTALAPVTKAVTDYAIKQKEISQKLEANKIFFEIQDEVNLIQDELKNDFDELNSVNSFNERFKAISNTKLNSITNKGVKSLLQNRLDLEYPEFVSTIKTNSRDALERQINFDHDTQQNVLMGNYILTDDKNKKQSITNKLIENEISYSKNIDSGQTELNKSINKLKSDLLISDVEKNITNNNFGAALELIKNPSKTPFLDFEERDKLLAKIQTGFTEQGSLQNLDNLFLSGQGSTAVGAGIKNIDGKEITQKDLEKTANRFALTTNEDGSLKYNTAQVIEQANINNTKVPLYLETLDAGGNITDTSSKDATLSGLQLYQTFKNQNALQSLTSVYQLGKDDLATYQRLDFAINTMKQTFEQAFNNELQFKNNPDKFKLLKADGKAVTAKVNELDFPGVTPFELGLEFENEAYANIIMKNVANNVMIATGSEKTALEFAKNYIEENYRIDDFKQLVPINNAYPEYHDQAIKLYIKDLYESGRINKEQHKEEDIIPVYFTVGSLTSNQGFVLRDRNTGVPITIDVVDPQGDFDEGSYDKARMTFKDIVEKIYPLMKDQRYEDFVIKYNRLKESKRQFDETINVMP